MIWSFGGVDVCLLFLQFQYSNLIISPQVVEVLHPHSKCPHSIIDCLVYACLRVTDVVLKEIVSMAGASLFITHAKTPQSIHGEPRIDSRPTHKFFFV